jgi:hypothetical protein
MGWNNDRLFGQALKNLCSFSLQQENRLRSSKSNYLLTEGINLLDGETLGLGHAFDEA